ncbi:MAG TPA: hypothetical protein VMV45_12200 [Casimicrobiaceae bacterium]|nr:hypothetical protein [Casimicrobiaceae bacterium]
MRIATPFIACALAATLGGCFTVGTPFNSAAPDQLRLGQTTSNQVIALVGPATNATTPTVNGVTLQCLDYDSYKAGGTAQGKGLLGRSASYCFLDNVLVAYVVSSNIDAESSDFDVQKALTVTRGMTRAQVVDLLGKPAGAAVYPFVNAGGTEVRYSYTDYTGTFSTKRTTAKDAYFEFDGNDIVVDARVQVKER